ncbi:MAG: ABC transporter permease [Gordonia sp. (in: high G+C Gram-positive bacteria)]
MTISSATPTGGRRSAPEPAVGAGRQADSRRRVVSRLASGILTAPGLALLVLLAAGPLIALVIDGFTTDSTGFTLENFADTLGSAVFVKQLVRTVIVALIVTVASMALSWPAAWALGRYVPARTRQVVLGIALVPFITSQLLLMYGFMTLTQPKGPLMSLLAVVGVDSGSSLLYTPVATVLMLIYESIPTAVLVLTAASTQIDESVLESARVLGAGRLRVFGTVIWPLSVRMVGVNFGLTFVMTIGAFAEPAILGGPNGQLVGNVIQSQLSSGVGQHSATALSLLLLVIALVVVGVVAGALSLTGGDSPEKETP